MSRRRKEFLYSKVSVKSQTVLPQQVREALDIKPGDTVRYLLSEGGVVIDKAPVDSDDPFATFAEWSGRNDDDAYADL
jgi:antitoxin PrlF